MPNDNIELTRGYKIYDAKMKNLAGIFSKLKNVNIDITEYIQEWIKITNDVEKDTSLKNVMLSDQMQLDYEDLAFTTYINRLDKLLKKLEKEIIPFYELYLLYSKIKLQLLNITNETINDTITNTKQLIDALNLLNTHNNKQKNNIIKNAYKTIYAVILYEEIFNRNDILTYINTLNIPTNKENIGRLLAKDLKHLKEIDLIEEDLQNLKTEGLGYDYLKEDIIRKISRKRLGKKNSEYTQRKNQAISTLSKKVEIFSIKKDRIKENLDNINNMISVLNDQKRILVMKALSLLFIPIITTTAGNAIGTSMSKKITEYSTITRTIDLNTSKIIGEPTEIFDEKETTYVATVLVYSPWKQKIDGSGYTSNIIAYEYTVPETKEEEYQITNNIPNDNMIEKYRFTESKETLEKSDSTEHSTILITETYQDKKRTRQSTKYIIPFSIIGISIGLVVDTVLILIANFGLIKTKETLEELNDRINTEKLNKKEIQEILKEMQNEAFTLQEEYNTVVKDFGTLKDQFIVLEIEETWLENNKRKKTL